MSVTNFVVTFWTRRDFGEENVWIRYVQWYSSAPSHYETIFWFLL